MTNAEAVCGSCDCADPTTMPELRRECSCGCHGRRKPARKPAALPAAVPPGGAAKHTPGPRCAECRWADSLAGASFLGVTLCPLHAAAGDLLKVARRVEVALYKVTPFSAESGKLKARLQIELRAAIAKAEGREG